MKTEAKDPREYGFEGEMAMSQLKGIMQHAESLHGMLKPDTDLPEWVQSKITLAYDYIQTATDYMSTEMNEEAQLDEISSKTLFSYGKKARKEAEKIDDPMHRARGRLLASKKTNPARGGYKLTKVAATFEEEAPTNAAGSGSVEGIGVGAKGEPGVRKTKYQKKNAAEAPKGPVMDGMVRRKLPSFKQFMG